MVRLTDEEMDRQARPIMQPISNDNEVINNAANGSNQINAYPVTLETSGCARSLDWSRRRLMSVT